MSKTPILEEIDVGPYRGWLAEEYRSAGIVAALRALPERLAAPGARELPPGNRLVIRTALPAAGGPIDTVVTSAPSGGFFKDRVNRRIGSRARRCAQAAVALERAGVGTPPVIGYLDRWEGGRLRESHFLARYVESPSFKAELVRLYRQDPECARFMALLECVAREVRRMHDAGVVHGDLGNQNIIVERDGPDGWRHVRIIDLHRARVRDVVGLRERARDISRIALPSDFLRVFIEMYFAAPPPDEFLRQERAFRRAFDLHTRSRPFRHPIRERRRARAARPEENYPAERDIWVWDERSVQAIGALRSRDRARLYPATHVAGMVFATLAALPRVWPEYRHLLAGSYAAPVLMRDRVGIALTAHPDYAERERALLEPWGRVPVFFRFYAHEREPQWTFTAGLVEQYRAAGFPVEIALVQDRASVRDPARWEGFCRAVLGRVARRVERVEIGHALNRSKWGLWSMAEYRRMLEATAAVAADFPGLACMGPAGIDFEYPFVLAALRQVPPGFRFAALSHHLYVDRRGAPENRQGAFDTLRKLALARALARSSGCCDDRLVISEVNWPLAGTGVHSPVGSPYASPGPRHGDPSVTEEDYAAYMLRYLCIALCSGLAERVFWWRLTARGFGLVDDTDPRAWRPRPAYHALTTFLQRLGSATFTRRLVADPGASVLEFAHPRDGLLAMGWSHAGPCRRPAPFRTAGAFDMVGRRLPPPSETLDLAAPPCYFTDMERIRVSNSE